MLIFFHRLDPIHIKTTRKCRSTVPSQFKFVLQMRLDCQVQVDGFSPSYRALAQFWEQNSIFPQYRPELYHNHAKGKTSSQPGPLTGYQWFVGGFWNMCAKLLLYLLRQKSFLVKILVRKQKFLERKTLIIPLGAHKLF